MIYIACYNAGQAGPSTIAAFNDKIDFYYYCDRLLEMRDTKVNRSMTIDQLCDSISDIGFGRIGSRYYRRINKSAIPCNATII